ncbi:hypothetical protein J42TS3_29620 [Paenibacillus vini]|uniref:Uncharacterized protein n=1 Tax=Paenibacillus vini TaxID=1476024 RepID=A0ABQ4MD55_9BACL|nr:hypothetical protein J42TS3_29620 [Paenibacillus vini]
MRWMDAGCWGVEVTLTKSKSISARMVKLTGKTTVNLSNKALLHDLTGKTAAISGPI